LIIRVSPFFFFFFVNHESFILPKERNKETFAQERKVRPQAFGKIKQDEVDDLMI